MGALITYAAYSSDSTSNEYAFGIVLIISAVPFLFRGIQLKFDRVHGLKRSLLSMVGAMGIAFVVVAGIFYAASTGVVNALEFPPDSEIIWRKLDPKISGNIATFRGTVRNKSFLWDATNVRVEVTLLDENSDAVETRTVRVSPYRLYSNFVGVYSEEHELPSNVTRYTSELLWDWDSDY